MKSKLSEVLLEISKNTKKGSKNYYKPLDPEKSKIARDYYRTTFYIPTDGDDTVEFYNKSGTQIAIGYNRVVIGDYGAYVEFDKEHMCLENIKQKWPGEPKRKVKYIWMETKDECKTKIYYQQGIVAYADYKVGCYYVTVGDVEV